MRGDEHRTRRLHDEVQYDRIEDGAQRGGAAAPEKRYPHDGQEAQDTVETEARQRVFQDGRQSCCYRNCRNCRMSNPAFAR